MNAADARPSFTSELDPSAPIDGDLFTAFAAGELPAARLVHVARVADGHEFALPGGRVVRTVAWQHTRWLLVEGPGWRVRVRADSDGETFACDFGVTADVVERVAAYIARWNQPAPSRPDSVEVTFCSRGPHGVVRRRRRIDAAAVYVSDPDRLVNDPAYLNSIVLDDDDRPGDDDAGQPTRGCSCGGCTVPSRVPAMPRADRSSRLGRRCALAARARRDGSGRPATWGLTAPRWPSCSRSETARAGRPTRALRRLASTCHAAVVMPRRACQCDALAVVVAPATVVAPPSPSAAFFSPPPALAAASSRSFFSSSGMLTVTSTAPVSRL